MGLYLNSRDPYTLYLSETKNPYFVDKTLLLGDLFPLVEMGKQSICITRPRRFGKTIMANMIGSFFNKGCDAPVFDCLQIAANKDYHRHKNRHNVICIDFSKTDDECETYEAYIAPIKDILREDLHAAYPQVTYREKGTVSEDLLRITQATGETFIFVLDEWDYIFHQEYATPRDKARYIKFLSTLLKDRSYVEFTYMTGILPIAKYSSGSELNMFVEYTMSSQHLFGDYFGFTQKEVEDLFARYRARTENCRVTPEELRRWYDGYNTLNGERLYNPRSVVCALANNQVSDYWTSAGPYDEIFYYVKNNIADVRDDIAKMIAGESVTANVRQYAAVSTDLQTKDQIFSAMVVYGFLTTGNGRVSIPNRELMDKFVDMVQTERSLGYVYRLAKESARMLEATKAGDTEAMSAILQQAHDTETGMTGYNDEAELSAVVKLVYLSARDHYDMEREDKAGVGYVDYIFYPRMDLSDDCIILELKVDCPADEAIQQIRNRNYAQRFIGKLGETSPYTGRILAVGISYFKKDPCKKHEVRVEVLRERRG